MTQQPARPGDAMARKVRLIASGILVPIGLIFGLVQHSDNAGQSCGSTLVPRDISGVHVQGCEWALRGSTTWMWLLFGIAAFGVLSVLLTSRAPEQRG